ncbi:MAG: hypothetical protein KAG53_11130 [Endozoicomonadaceae bacterium]|nr:hypothetical protein [Endozoicomonadaceae bacterium]
MAARSKKKKERLTHCYPEISQQADESDATIFFLDESTAKSEHHRGRRLTGIEGL